MLFGTLVATSARLSSTRSRLKKVEALAALIGDASEVEVPLVVSYLSGQIPQGRLGIGPSLVERAKTLFSADESQLELTAVDERLQTISDLAGPGSSGRRLRQLSELLAFSTPNEQAFLARLFIGDLRQGSLEGLMVEAVAKVTEIDPEKIRRALMLSGDLVAVCQIGLTEGESGLARFHIELFRPLKPMLAQTADQVSEAFERLGRLALQEKLDGARIQVHRSGKKVRLYSRSLKDVTKACPEVVEAVLALDVKSVILDGEALALDGAGHPRPFQVTMRRFGRKLDVDSVREKLPLSSFFFDLLYLDGESWVDAPFEQRHARLAELLPESNLAKLVIPTEIAEGEAFVRTVLDSGHEGVMAKALDSPYQAGSRGFHWLKIKSAHTLDLVVLAAEWGSGRRHGWLSNLHLGAWDADGSEFVMLGKTFKGMTDAILEWQTKRLQDIETRRDDWTVYVRPELVVEIAFNELQTSPHYPGGLALRFARLKFYREDKRVEDADTMETVRAIHLRQSGSASD